MQVNAAFNPAAGPAKAATGHALVFGSLAPRVSPVSPAASRTRSSKPPTIAARVSACVRAR